jgi:hypothetical protein
MSSDSFSSNPNHPQHLGDTGRHCTAAVARGWEGLRGDRRQGYEARQEWRFAVPAKGGQRPGVWRGWCRQQEASDQAGVLWK